jgi:hypothetical protein
MQSSPLEKACVRYSEYVRSDFEVAIKNWAVDMRLADVHSVIGGLLARQSVLGAEFSLQSNLWNFSVGPLFMSAMVEIRVNMSWLYIDPEPRCRKFLLYGLGQEKLELEYKRSLDHPLESTRSQESWLNSQRNEIFTDVNVGTWSGKTVKEMAIEANIADSSLLHSALASIVHSGWDHVFQIYLDRPGTLDAKAQLPADNGKIEFLLSSARVLDETFSAFLQFTNQGFKPTAYRYLEKQIRHQTKDGN